MKTLNYAFVLLLLTLFCCSQDDLQTFPPIDNSDGRAELTWDTKGVTHAGAAGNSLGFIYKKSVWVKKNAAIQISKPAGKAILYNPDVWTVVEYHGLLSAYDAESIGVSGCDCATNEVCINGLCTNVTPCGGCPAGSMCINGICVPSDPCGGGCPAGQTCVNGICTPNDPCASCAPDETCINGTCQPNDPCANCLPNEFCINGTCQPDPCDDCEEDEICINGECQPAGGAEDIGQIGF